MDYSTVNVNILGNKAKTKNEIYRLLTVEAQLYLPPQKECSIYFVRDILCNKKKAFFVEEVKGERSTIVLEEKCVNARDYLPDKYESKNINRQWLCNLCSTFNSQDFDLMIYEAIKKREQHIVEKNKMEIILHPRIAQAVKDSNFISTSRGRSHMLIRKLSNSDEEDKDDISETDLRTGYDNQATQISILKNEIKMLKEELDNQNKENDESTKNANILNKLYTSGLIDEDGNLLS